MEIQEKIFRDFIEELSQKDEIEERIIEELMGLWENSCDFTEDELLTIINRGEANDN